jgi:hypothetical protein
VKIALRNDSHELRNYARMDIVCDICARSGLSRTPSYSPEAKVVAQTCREKTVGTGRSPSGGEVEEAHHGVAECM